MLLKYDLCGCGGVARSSPQPFWTSFSGTSFLSFPWTLICARDEGNTCPLRRLECKTHPSSCSSFEGLSANSWARLRVVKKKKKSGDGEPLNEDKSAVTHPFGFYFFGKEYYPLMRTDGHVFLRTNSVTVEAVLCAEKSAPQWPEWSVETGWGHRPANPTLCVGSGMSK